MGWYSQVSRDINQIPSAIQYFETELIEARKEVKLKGSVEKSSSEMPGIVEWQPDRACDCRPRSRRNTAQELGLSWAAPLPPQGLFLSLSARSPRATTKEVAKKR